MRKTMRLHFSVVADEAVVAVVVVFQIKFNVRMGPLTIAQLTFERC